MSFKDRIAPLNEADKSRILCVVLHATITGIDFSKAAEAWGSVSGESMSVMYRKTMKKILPAGGTNTNGDGTEAGGDQAAPTTPAKKGGRKRKDVNEDGTPSPKKPRASRAKGGKKDKNSGTEMVGKENGSENGEADIKAEKKEENDEGI